MSKKLKINLIFPLLLLLTVRGFSQNEATTTSHNLKSFKLVVGEELVYVVRYSVMRLGELKLNITGKEQIDGKDYYSAIIYIDSYPGIPFVDLHQVYETTMTPDYYSKYFKGSLKYDTTVSNTEYHFDYINSIVKIHKWFTNSNKQPVDSTCAVNKKYQDGLSIVYYSRAHSREKKYDVIPTFFNEKKVTTEVNFDTDRDDVSIDAVNYDIDCTHLEGKVNFISVFGLTGDFEGWFSNDEASVPIKAKMNVLIGSITLELKSWNRKGWNPPKYKD